MNTAKKVFGWILLLAALACFGLALSVIAATFGVNVAVIVGFSGLGLALMGTGSKMVG